MGTTPLGLRYPEVTDRVADGANAIKRLAEDVEAAAFLQTGKQTSTADNTMVGSGGFPNPVSDTITGLVASTHIPNPDKVFLGALAGFARYTGTQQPGAGSLQGGACEAYMQMSGTMTQAVLGWESIAATTGNGTYPLVIGGQSSAQVADSVTVTNLIGYSGRAPYSNGGSPTVTNAYTMNLQEPTIGAQRFTFYGAGRHRMSKGVHANVLEVCDSGDLIQWASNGKKLTGYASDGASQRITFDPTDGAAERIQTITSGAGAHLRAVNLGNEVFRVAYDGKVALLLAGTLKNVDVGAVDSGGAGYRMLRVVN